MGATWVAGQVRARALLRRRLGSAAVRDLAARPTLVDALEALAAVPYGRGLSPGQTLDEAEWALDNTLLWQLRVLAGWQPASGAGLVRALAGWFELSNVEERDRELRGRAVRPAYRLGALSVAWRRLAGAPSPAELRARLATSPWGDPGADNPEAIAVGLRVGWAMRVAAQVPEAAEWAVAAVALLVARERFLVGRTLTEPVRVRVATLLGPSAMEAATLSEFVARAPGPARPILSDVDGVDDLWRAENRWWSRVERDASALLREPGFGSAAVVGAIALLAVDTWRVRAALHLASRGGTPVEAFDALA